MRKNRVIEQNRCYHLVSRLAHRAFFLDDEEKDRAVALMRRVEAGVQVSMSYCINSAVSISSDPFAPPEDGSLATDMATDAPVQCKLSKCSTVVGHIALPPVTPTMNQIPIDELKDSIVVPQTQK